MKDHEEKANDQENMKICNNFFNFPFLTPLTLFVVNKTLDFKFLNRQKNNVFTVIFLPHPLQSYNSGDIINLCGGMPYCLQLEGAVLHFFSVLFGTEKGTIMSGLFAFLGLGGVGMPELIVVGAVMLLLFGNRLPGAMRSLGRSVVEFKKGVNGIEEDLNDAVRSADDKASHKSNGE